MGKIISFEETQMVMQENIVGEFWKIFLEAKDRTKESIKKKKCYYILSYNNIWFDINGHLVQEEGLTLNDLNYL